MNHFLTPGEIAAYTDEAGLKKSNLPIYKMILLGFLAGVFIAFASVGSNISVHNISDIGIAKLIAGTLFPTGLILVVIAGAELFTGNNLIVISCLTGKSTWSNFAKNLIVVWLSNLVGSVFVALLILGSGQLNYSGGVLGAYTIKVAVGKVNLTFLQAFCSGILCNWLVCLAVWMSYGAKDMAGKVLTIFCAIWLFILSGYEHCVANMYYISAGLLANTNENFVELAKNLYPTVKDGLNNLTIKGMFLNNLLPVTLGNLVGGVFFVGIIYYVIYLKPDNKKKNKDEINA